MLDLLLILLCSFHPSVAYIVDGFIFGIVNCYVLLESLVTDMQEQDELSRQLL